MSKRVITLTIIGFVLVLVLFGVLLRGRTPNIKLTVSPSAATVILDGKSRVSASFYAKPGKHTLKASFAGFADSTTTFTAVSGKTVAVSLYLPTNSDVGVQWLADHPSDANGRQTIVGQAFNDSSTERAKKYPILADLPYIEKFFRVDYEQSPTHPSDDTAVAFTITYYAPQGKQQALDWIQSLGYNPANFEIIYVDQSIVTTGGNE